MSLDDSPISINSHLSAPRYGYDFVVATSQQSINATMKEFLALLTEPTMTVCYVADDSEGPTEGDPILIDYETLKAKAHGTDPFEVPSGVDVKADQRIKNLEDARFMCAFRAQLGMPHAKHPDELPDLVELGSAASAVTFNLYCATFTIVQYTERSTYHKARWLNQSQDPNKPWLFTTTVDLLLEPTQKYGQLPPDVQKQIKNLGSSAFSVQQLLFDLTNARLESKPKMSDVDPESPLGMALDKYFVGEYFTQMQKESRPLLGCSIAMSDTPVSTLIPTDLEFMVNPYLDKNGTPTKGPLSTLNYLCSVESSDHDGVISINRDTFADYFHSKLFSYVQDNCIEPHTTCSLLTFGLTFTRGNNPVVARPPDGSPILTYHYTSGSSSSFLENSFEMKTIYSLEVQVSDPIFRIVQRSQVYMNATELFAGAQGNVFDRSVIDTYTLDVDASGKLVTTCKPYVGDSGRPPRIHGTLSFFNTIEALITQVSKAAEIVASLPLHSMPISIAQDYIFPGGNTFIFKKAGFSPYQDLLGFISYAEPSGGKAKVHGVPPRRPDFTASVKAGQGASVEEETSAAVLRDEL